MANVFDGDTIATPASGGIMADVGRDARRMGLSVSAIEKLGEAAVYCLRGDHGYWKIGHSTSVIRRIVSIKCGVPFDLEVAFLAYFGRSGLRDYERGLLAATESWTSRGEWRLVPDDDLAEFALRLEHWLGFASAIVPGPAIHGIGFDGSYVRHPAANMRSGKASVVAP